MHFHEKQNLYKSCKVLSDALNSNISMILSGVDQLKVIN